MLVQQPDLPLFSIVGEYCSSYSTPSTNTTQTQPSAFLNLPLSVAVLANRHLALNRLIPHQTTNTPTSLNRLAKLSSTNLQCLKPPSSSTHSMPRQQPPKVNQESETGAFPHNPPAPCVAGAKRNAAAISGNAVPRQLVSSPAAPLDSNDQPPLRLPPKLKEAERMMHVQRWVNHLSWPTSDANSTTCPTHWGYSTTPGYSHTDEDREHTPPPSRTYLSRLPFTTEEEQTMLRFFSTSSDFRNANHSGALQNPCPSHNIPYHAQRTTALHQAAANLHLAVSAQPPNVAGDVNQPTFQSPDKKSVPHRNLDHDVVAGSRFFAEWETRLISHLFQEYFPGRPEPMGNAGILPSLGEVRSRIASSRLKETRTPVAVRAKIKRMQSSGTWVEFQ